MPISFTLIGQISVMAGAEEDLPVLVETLGLLEDAEIENGELRISMQCDAAPWFARKVLKAAEAFCTKWSTEGAVFDHGDGDVLIFGPTPRMRQQAHLQYLLDLVEEAQSNYDVATGSSLTRYKEQFQ